MAPHDRRAKLVALTPAALPLIARLDGLADSLRQEIMADLTPEEIAVALRVLHKVRAQLDRAEAGRAAAAAEAAVAPSAPSGTTSPGCAGELRLQHPSPSPQEEGDCEAVQRVSRI